MIIIYFLNGLAFSGLGLAAYLQMHHEGEFPLKHELPWLAAFGFFGGATAWVDMFITSGSLQDLPQSLTFVRMVLQPLTGLILVVFGWRTLRSMGPLPSWTLFLPGVLVVPIAYVITFAATTFVTPSPIEIPSDIWSRYLLYLPGSLLAGLGFLRLWDTQRKLGLHDVARLMLGAGLAFFFEAFVVGLVVPAAPYGPASYYIYDRTSYNAFVGEGVLSTGPFGLNTWLDYAQVRESTGLPIEFWRMLSALLLSFFVIRGLGVFDAIQKRRVVALQVERDRARQTAFEAQTAARQTAENWTNALVNIGRHITELDDVDHILLYIVEQTRDLLHSDYVGLALQPTDAAELLLRCYAAGAHVAMLDDPRQVGNELILNAFRAGVAYVSPERTDSIQLSGACPGPGIEPSPGAIAVVCLRLDSQPIGAFWVARLAEEPYTETDSIWLECLADQVVIAIKHGLMTSQLQSLSVTEERGRIAREMHDGLAQVLGYLNLQVQTLQALIEQGKLEKANARLAQMGEAIQMAHADVREEILSLRTTLANEKGMVPSIADYVAEFAIQTQIQSRFENEIQGEVNLASVAEVQLVCILQEALSNVRKHAHAAHVTVTLTRERQLSNEMVIMRVRDDGVGFQSGGSKRSFGLQTMRERSQSVKGNLTVHSVPGQGTEVECRLPCLSSDHAVSSSVVFK